MQVASFTPEREHKLVDHNVVHIKLKSKETTQKVRLRVKIACGQNHQSLFYFVSVAPLVINKCQDGRLICIIIPSEYAIAICFFDHSHIGNS